MSMSLVQPDNEKCHQKDLDVSCNLSSRCHDFSLEEKTNLESRLCCPASMEGMSGLEKLRKDSSFIELIEYLRLSQCRPL